MRRERGRVEAEGDHGGRWRRRGAGSIRRDLLVFAFATTSFRSGGFSRELWIHKATSLCRLEQIFAKNSPTNDEPRPRMTPDSSSTLFSPPLLASSFQRPATLHPFLVMSTTPPSSAAAASRLISLLSKPRFFIPIALCGFFFFTTAVVHPSSPVSLRGAQLPYVSPYQGYPPSLPDRLASSGLGNGTEGGVNSWEGRRKANAVSRRSSSQLWVTQGARKELTSPPPAL